MSSHVYGCEENATVNLMFHGFIFDDQPPAPLASATSASAAYAAPCSSSSRPSTGVPSAITAAFSSSSSIPHAGSFLASCIASSASVAFCSSIVSLSMTDSISSATTARALSSPSSAAHARSSLTVSADAVSPSVLQRNHYPLIGLYHAEGTHLGDCLLSLNTTLHSLSVCFPFSHCFRSPSLMPSFTLVLFSLF